MVNWLQVTSKLRKKIFVAWFYNVYGRYFASSSLIDQFFGGNFEIEMKCTENDEEKPTDSTENFLQLSCFISQEVKYMLSGIKSVRYMQCTLHVNYGDESFEKWNFIFLRNFKSNSLNNHQL